MKIQVRKTDYGLQYKDHPQNCWKMLPKLNGQAEIIQYFIDGRNRTGSGLTKFDPPEIEWVNINDKKCHYYQAVRKSPDQWEVRTNFDTQKKMLIETQMLWPAAERLTFLRGLTPDEIDVPAPGETNYPEDAIKKVLSQDAEVNEIYSKELAGRMDKFEIMAYLENHANSHGLTAVIDFKE